MPLSVAFVLPEPGRFRPARPADAGTKASQTSMPGPERTTPARSSARSPQPGTGAPGPDESGLLAERCRAGDPAAWVELVRLQHRRVYALCYRFTGNSADAEDLSQDVFLKVHRNLDNFDSGKGSFQTWLTTLARNLLVDHFRRSRQDRATDSIDANWEGSDDESPALATRIEDGGPSPHASAVSRQTASIVQQALTQLSPELREAVILRDLQDFDYKEIAQVLRVPEGTVKSRISRGRAELARLLERMKGQVM
jgi:RNA polymerase sigma-70 factor, ECF subfamily